MFLFRTKFPSKRTRRKKPEEDLKTLYYYRTGTLHIHPTDNSNIGLYMSKYVYIRKYNQTRDQFLIEDADGNQTWTDFVIPVRPEIGGHDVYHICFSLIIGNDWRDGSRICYRIKNGFSFLKKENKHNPDESYVLYKDHTFNLNRIPKAFNFCLGYAENEAVNKEKQIDHKYEILKSESYGESS